MSQILHRQRTRDRREAEREGGISNFSPQALEAKLPKISKARRTPQQVQPERLDPLMEEDPAPAIDWDQAAVTAAIMVELDSQAYEAAMQDLQEKSPAFYDAVVVELDRLTQDDMGDGMDIHAALADHTGSEALQVAQELASVSPEEYQQRLLELEQSNPEFYAAVTQALVAMHTPETKDLI